MPLQHSSIGIPKCSTVEADCHYRRAFYGLLEASVLLWHFDYDVAYLPRYVTLRSGIPASFEINICGCSKFKEVISFKWSLLKTPDVAVPSLANYLVGDGEIFLVKL